MATRPRSTSITRKPYYVPPSGMMSPPTPMASRRYASHRLSNASMTSTSSYSSYHSTGTHASAHYPPTSHPSLMQRILNTVELIFTNLIDTLIFTSAIFLTAYRYWAGKQIDSHDSPFSSSPLSSPRPSHSFHPTYPSPPSQHAYAPHNQLSSHGVYEAHSHGNADMKRQDPPIGSFRPELSLVVTPPTTPKWRTSDPAWSDLKHPAMDIPQTQSNPACKKKEKPQAPDQSDQDDEEDDDRVNRIEETLQALIRQGQEALSSTIDWEGSL
ncbi:hypothetical protein DM01DRAFT_1337957 [Hesseltinella vesiculosa]|uniref:Uncharacterized protein n=1 Tax=Hesseltinella vesiculosa TaxID=101127 RepID=A0A1X2GBE1_9FUNG|nr:hypothetical protein DM01DRAFT_1337957 [Hesseltinella vesiculosa]